ncbi:amidohydrolase [Sphingobacterium sp. SRCM116780]|uniref:M20 metallopeptidase family protein n=1 Tax=Sphingobacterium sp. SRCM116780 TaxID=2907623 RepID=UPI001F1A80AA|nr:amidohydrolase [Sphingobacterium sp. SRCM116780]UIR54759.1 amidohydrolase [Sphingobacterium sp. SRCM116780]
MKTLLLLICCSFSLLCSAQKQNMELKQSIKNNTEDIFKSLVALRRDFHQHPELAGGEKVTKDKIINYLLSLGLEVKANGYGNSVIGILRGKKPGPAIGWRSDMDALPMDESTDSEFKSNNKGVSHGCGHDVHMTIALGIAQVLKKYKNDFSGTLYFIFQPEEESFIGAKRMVEGKHIDSLQLNEIYGLHVTALPVGDIMVRPNEIFAYQRRLQVQFNSVVEKEKLIQLKEAISTQISRVNTTTSPADISKMVDPNLGLGNPNTIFADYLFVSNFSMSHDNENGKLSFDVYETDKNKISNLVSTVEKIIENKGLKERWQSISFIMDNPTVQNDSSLTSNAFQQMDRLKLSYGQAPYFNDDFAYFQKEIPGVYFLLGGSNIEKGIIAMNHAPNFQVDEACIQVAVQEFSSFLLHRMKL